MMKIESCTYVEVFNCVSLMMDGHVIWAGGGHYQSTISNINIDRIMFVGYYET